jgi:hypothetical protein
MKHLSVFIKDEFVKENVDSFFTNSICIDTIEQITGAVLNVSYGNYANIVFANSQLKERFLDKLSSIRPDINIINCNCTVSRFFENKFNGFLVFNNLKRCQHAEIIEEIKKHNGILLC